MTTIRSLEQRIERLKERHETTTDTVEQPPESVLVKKIVLGECLAVSPWEYIGTDEDLARLNQTIHES